MKKCGITALQWSLGIVILIEAVRFLMPAAGHAFASTHIPAFIRMILGVGEVIGCVVMLIPAAAVRGAWLLLAVFVFAILIHLMHGLYNVGDLVVYAASAFAIATNK